MDMNVTPRQVICYVTATTVVTIAMILSIVSVLTDSWVIASVNGKTVEVGLWRMCIGQGEVCYELKDAAGVIPNVAIEYPWIQAVRGLLIISIIITIPTIGFAISSWCIHVPPCNAIYSWCIPFWNVAVGLIMAAVGEGMVFYLY